MRPYAVLVPMLMALGLVGCSSLPKDPDTRALARAALHGSAKQQFNVAKRLQEQGDPLAYAWFKRAATHVSPDGYAAQSAETLGDIYRVGNLDTHANDDADPSATHWADPRQASKWYHQAARYGSAYAMMDLVRMYVQQEDGQSALRWRMRYSLYVRRFELLALNVDRIGARARAQLPQWQDDIRRRAERGDADALVDLGNLHEAGLGMPVDVVAALDCYRRAGAQGNVYGQYFAGLLLGRGPRGIEQDLDEAADWFARAYAQGFYNAREAYWREAIKPMQLNFE